MSPWNIPVPGTAHVQAGRMVRSVLREACVSRHPWLGENHYWLLVNLDEHAFEIGIDDPQERQNVPDYLDA
jgi:hypothetical protein